MTAGMIEANAPAGPSAINEADLHAINVAHATLGRIGRAAAGHAAISRRAVNAVLNDQRRNLCQNWTRSSVRMSMESIRSRARSK